MHVAWICKTEWRQKQKCEGKKRGKNNGNNNNDNQQTLQTAILKTDAGSGLKMQKW